jgi:hypothetical protein
MYGVIEESSRHRGGKAEAVAAPRRVKEASTARVDYGDGGRRVPPSEGAAANAAPTPD